MAEHEVMWIGRKPAALASEEHPAGTEAFAAAVTEACESCGCDVSEYIAAAGLYGSWMIRFTRGDGRQRVVWNGKEGRLVLERLATAVDWSELAGMPVSQRDAEGFVVALRSLLATPA